MRVYLALSRPDSPRSAAYGPIGHTETLVPTERMAKIAAELPRYNPPVRSRIRSIYFGHGFRKRLGDSSLLVSLPA
jgi:hypothetical protein